MEDDIWKCENEMSMSKGPNATPHECWRRVLTVYRAKGAVIHFASRESHVPSKPLSCSCLFSKTDMLIPSHAY
jgi:hypothetical protein